MITCGPAIIAISHHSEKVLTLYTPSMDTIGSYVLYSKSISVIILYLL